MHHERITAAASALAAAIADARAAGYRVQFPDHALTGIAVSETARVAQVETTQPAQPAPPQAEVPLVGKPGKAAPAA